MPGNPSGRAGSAAGRPIRQRLVAAPRDRPPSPPPSRAFQGRRASPPPRRPRPSRAAVAREGAEARGRDSAAVRCGAGGGGGGIDGGVGSRGACSVFRQGQAYRFPRKAVSRVPPLPSSQPFPPDRSVPKPPRPQLQPLAGLSGGPFGGMGGFQSIQPASFPAPFSQMHTPRCVPALTPKLALRARETALRLFRTRPQFNPLQSPRPLAPETQSLRTPSPSRNSHRLHT